jgi:hypothetical protein
LEYAYLETLRNIFETLKEKAKHPEMILADRPVSEWEMMQREDLCESCKSLNFTDFKKALRSVPMDALIMKHDPSEKRRLMAHCLETVSAVDSLVKSFIFYSHNSTPTFNTARLLVPPKVRGGVILDATAGCNVVYDLFERATVIQPPPNTRIYKNVTLHVSYGHNVGQSEMKKNALKLSQDLVANLDEQFAGEQVKRKVLVVTHKKVEPLLITCKPKNFTLAVAHWGAVDGSNEWNDFDTVVIFGLPYKPKRWAPSIFMGYQGVQSTPWLNDSSLRSFKNHEDIRKAIDLYQMVTDIIQAVNRVKCRRIIDEEGNCPNTDIFILLPPQGEGESLVKGITEEMPGVQVTEWDFRHQKQAKRGRKSTGRGNWDQSLVAYLQCLNPGDRVSASGVRKTLTIKDKAWEEIVSRINTAGSWLQTELQRLEVCYETVRQRSSFLKAGV